jgi:hypothetical protein
MQGYLQNWGVHEQESTLGYTNFNVLVEVYEIMWETYIVCE